MSGGGEHLKDEGTRLQVVAAGATAGLVSRFCIAPLDVLKIRLQLQIHSLAGPDRHGMRFGALDTFKDILKHEGVTALWKGNIPAELLYISYGAIQFSVYRLSTQFLAPLHLPPGGESFLAGAFAGASATTFTYPLDLLRTRFAAQGHQKAYMNLRTAVRDIALHEGLPGFFQGLGAGIVQIMPYMGLFFGAYETLRAPIATMALPYGSGDATAGVLASIIAKTGVFPLDLIRKRLQVQGPTRSKYVNGTIPQYSQGVVKTGQMILATEGWRGLYRGLGIGLIKSAPASAVTMWTYERALMTMRSWESSASDM